MALTLDDFQKVADDLGCEAAAVQAVQEVETGGTGGFNPDGTPKILFEALWFHKLTKGVYDANYPNISSPTWNRALYGKTWETEQARLEQARQLNQDAAFQAASWGMFQVMGFNHASLGFSTVIDFVATMATDELSQLQIFADFVKHNHLTQALIDKDWAAFALRYNGAQYAANHYSEKLQTAYAKYSGA